MNVEWAALAGCSILLQVWVDGSVLARDAGTRVIATTKPLLLKQQLAEIFVVSPEPEARQAELFRFESVAVINESLFELHELRTCKILPLSVVHKTCASSDPLPSLGAATPLTQHP